MELTTKTIDRLNQLIIELKDGQHIAVEGIALALWNDGIKWDIAIQAMESGEPKAFFDFFKHYRTATLDECVAAVQDVDIDFLASMLAFEARSVSHWDYIYTNEVNNFFIAGLERLLEVSKLN